MYWSVSESALSPASFVTSGGWSRIHNFFYSAHLIANRSYKDIIMTSIWHTRYAEIYSSRSPLLLRAPG